MLYNNIIDTIGNTPLVKINGLPEDYANVYVKLESRNPSGSVKDRPVKYILQDLLDKGIIEKGSTIVESTSGNTGIGLSMAGTALGFKIVIVMPETMSEERKDLMRAYGAELILTPGEGGMSLAGEKAEEIAKERNGIIFGQFSNPANVKAHEETTAQEILADLPEVDAFVAGIGTGGTVSGVGRALKKAKADLQIWAVEPEDSPLISQGKASSHKIQGLGANFVPEILDKDVIDHYELVSNEEAINTAVELGRSQGILSGYSGGANYTASLRLAKQLGKGKHVVTVIPDSGERYLAGGFYGENRQG